jgi:hypothetical protein
MPHHYGLLPLHGASKAMSRQNKKSVDILLEAYPDAVRHRDTIDGSLPLHYMLDEVQALVDAFPDSVRTTNNLGWPPMHSGCSAIGLFNDVEPPEIMHFLTELFPQALLVPSRD